MTRIILLMSLSFTLTACSGGAVNQGRDKEWPTDSDGADDTNPTGDDTNAGDDTAEGDADTDTDSDSDTDIQWDGPCGNYWDPIDLSGWTKTYTVTYNGSPGTEEQVGQGESFGGRYRYDTNMSTESGNGWNGYVQVACGYGGDEGLHIIDWQVDYLSDGGSLGEVTTTHDAPRKYLPDESVVGSVGSWNYSYVMQAQLSQSDTATPMDFPVQIDGTYVERGEREVDLGGTTFTGYLLVNTYVMVSEGFLGFGAFRREGTIEQVWVKGVGLVQENHDAQLDDGSTSAIYKTLTSYTGLTPIQ